MLACRWGWTCHPVHSQHAVPIRSHVPLLVRISCHTLMVPSEGALLLASVYALRLRV